MANIRVPPDSSGKRVDAASIDDGADVVFRQRVVIGDNVNLGGIAAILSAGPIGSEGGIVTRNIPSGIQQVEGRIDAISATVSVVIATPYTLKNISATVNVVGNFSANVTVGMIQGISATVLIAVATPFTINNISATVNVAGNFTLTQLDRISATVIVSVSTPFTLQGISTTVIVAVSTPFTLQGISTTVMVAGALSLAGAVTVSGLVGLTAGTAVIGDINAISRTVQVAIATPFTINNISAAVVLAAGGNNIGVINEISRTVQVAIQTPFTLNNISATVTVAGSVGLAAGTTLNAISATVMVAAGPVALPSASHGPKCVTCSTSAAVALVAAPGIGLSVYITMLACTNGSAVLTRADAYGGSATASAVSSMYIAPSGGGYVMRYDPPIQILSNTAVNVRVKPSVSQAIFNVNYYVAPG